MKKLLLLLGVFVGFHASAQIDVVGNQTAAALAQTLTGSGVIVMNPTLNCPTIANGKFTSMPNTTLGIDSGIVLTSGRAQTGGGIGISGTTNQFPSTNNNAAGDADLTTLINSNNGGTIQTHDACILEFNFIPSGDTIKFDYVLGSEEYDGNNGNFNCSINDVFGFFISGNGYTVPKNIALVPGTTNVMVGVSTVNNGNSASATNACGYNTFGNGPYTQYFNDIYAQGNQYITYNGLTDVFTAVAGVVPCDTYHLKLAIADASDYAWDSGVFLKAGSLNSTGIVATPMSTYGANTLDSAVCIRGCKSGHVQLSRNAPRPTPLVIQYLLGGTAVGGVDYQALTGSAIIPANQTTVEIEVKPLLVQYATGPRSVIVKVLSPYNCGTTGAANIIDSATIWIYDSLYANIPTPPTTVCPRTEIAITADIDTSLDFTWTPTALIPDPLPLGLTVHPKPVIPTVYTITVSQPGAPPTCPTVSRSYLANVEPIPQLVLPTHDTTLCIIDSVDLPIHAEPLGYNYTYNWSPSSNLRNNFDDNNKFFAPVGNYKYVITATTPVGCSNKDSMNIHVIPPFTFDAVTPSDTTIHYGDRIQLGSQSEAIYWLWDPITFLSDPTVEDPWAAPTENIVYSLIGINKYGCRDTAKVKINVDYISKIGMPNAFSPNGDGVNDIFKIGNFQFEKMTEFKVFNRWGQQVYDGRDPQKGWDGTINGKPAASDTYFYIVKLTMPGGEQKVFKGDVILLR